MPICPICHENLPEIAERCPFCQEPVKRESAPSVVVPSAAAPSAAPAARTPPPPPPAAAAIPVAPEWERGVQGVLGRWWGTLWESLLHPDRFYAGVGPRGSAASAYHFYYLSTLISLLPAAFCGIVAVVILTGIAVAAPSSAHVPVGVVAAVAVGGMALAPVLLYVFGWLGMAFCSVIAHVSGLLFGARGGLRGTFRMLCYTGGTQVVGVVGSFVGLGWIAWIWQVVQVFFGYRRVHGLSSGRALGAMLLPFLFCVVLPAALIVGLVFGVWIGVMHSMSMPHEMREQTRATADEFAAAWQSGDEEALARLVPDESERAPLLENRPDRVRVDCVRRQAWFDRFAAGRPEESGDTVVATLEVRRGQVEFPVFVYLRPDEGGWSVARLWQPPCCDEPPVPVEIPPGGC